MSQLPAEDLELKLLCNCLQQLGYPQYPVPLASSGFASMKELCLINSAAFVDALKTRPTPATALTGVGAADFIRHCKKRMAQEHQTAC